VIPRECAKRRAIDESVSGYGLHVGWQIVYGKTYVIDGVMARAQVGRLRQ